jgi:hypothetical protein
MDAVDSDIQLSEFCEVANAQPAKAAADPHTAAIVNAPHLFERARFSSKKQKNPRKGSNQMAKRNTVGPATKRIFNNKAYSPIRSTACEKIWENAWYILY